MLEWEKRSQGGEARAEPQACPRRAVICLSLPVTAQCVCPLLVIRGEFPEVSNPNPGETVSPRTTVAAQGPPEVSFPLVLGLETMKSQRLLLNG